MIRLETLVIERLLGNEISVFNIVQQLPQDFVLENFFILSSQAFDNRLNRYKKGLLFNISDILKSW